MVHSMQDKNLNEDSTMIDSKPLLPKISEGKRLTLVLDLDETLIHYDESSG
jgi:predicted HAD superfamily phosphohydrolase YqeG